MLVLAELEAAELLGLEHVEEAGVPEATVGVLVDATFPVDLRGTLAQYGDECLGRRDEVIGGERRRRRGADASSAFLENGGVHGDSPLRGECRDRR
ncbi:hypothetical protein [Agromyces sp. NPDC049794]|uniref:hypothetical protein n=1 Tax=unclassified Agromyces TaxID=2639701 RepID=UPI0033E66CD9